VNRPKTRTVLVWIAQAILAVILIAFVGRSVYLNWAELSTQEVAFNIRPLWILSAAITVWLTYGLLIEAWRRVVTGWNQTLGYGPAMRIWCLSNLGRYLPGKIWSVAALAVLAQRTGVAGWAAAGSAVVMQVIALGTGVLVVSVSAPGVATPIALGGAFCLAVCVVVALTWEPAVNRIGRMVGPGIKLRALPVRAALSAAVVTLTGWIAYGMALWMLGRGIFGGSDLSAFLATGVFAAGYIVGLLALFAPGGVGVRELVFVALLAPVLGSGAALALSIASRLLLTATEALAALGALFVDRRKEKTVDKPA